MFIKRDETQYNYRKEREEQDRWKACGVEYEVSDTFNKQIINV